RSSPPFSFPNRPQSRINKGIAGFFVFFAVSKKPPKNAKNHPFLARILAKFLLSPFSLSMPAFMRLHEHLRRIFPRVKYRAKNAPF
ncbi:MAG: hypothetical protein ACI4P6_06355, partial [Candidatus Spyradosoma sp.]